MRYSRRRRIPRRLGWCERPVVRAVLLAALDKKREARRQCKTKHITATWKTLRAACNDPLRGVCGKTRYTSPTPRHEGPVQTPEKDGGPGREENRRTTDHQGREPLATICCETRGTSSGGGRGSSAICSPLSLPHSNHPSSRRYSSGGRHRRRPERGRKSGNQNHSRQSQRTRRRYRQSGRWQTGKCRALTHSQ